jgi:sterol 24-C-methyltransferase
MITLEPLPANIMRSRPASGPNSNVKETAQAYVKRFQGPDASVEQRKQDAPTLVNEYYDLVTDFYEYGWGDAFHFAPRYQHETFPESLARHEYFLAGHGQFKPGMKVMDVGCGVGGPMRNICRFSGVSAVGVNNNAYQITRAAKHTQRAHLGHLCTFVKSDFMHTPFKDSELDGAYAIEATCHAADKTACFAEIFRVLKPGAAFVGYEWVVTDKYDAGSAEHRRIKETIELGNALPELETAHMVRKALENAGFKVEMLVDLAQQFAESPCKTIPWYAPLEGSFSLSGFKSTRLGRLCTSGMVRTLEFLHLAPKGSSQTAWVLEEAAASLVEGGKLGVFTPMLMFKAVKP